MSAILSSPYTVSFAAALHQLIMSDVDATTLPLSRQRGQKQPTPRSAMHHALCEIAGMARVCMRAPLLVMAMAQRRSANECCVHPAQLQRMRKLEKHATGS